MKRIIEIRINYTNDKRGWSNIRPLFYHASSFDAAMSFADSISSYNNAQVRWNWKGCREGCYTNDYSEKRVVEDCNKVYISTI